MPCTTSRQVPIKANLTPAGDKFAPYGYVPAEMRGQPAIRLIAGTPRETIPMEGALDGVSFTGRAYGDGLAMRSRQPPSRG